MSVRVQEMFSTIAPSYDRVNTVLSLGTHHSWRKAAVKAARLNPGDSVLDCATGTGDLAVAMKKQVGEQGRVVGTDFCAEMLQFAPAKAGAAEVEIEFQQADVLNLPFPDQTFTASSISFGIRNVDDPVRCLREMSRVVVPGGRVVVLEFGQPKGLFGFAYRFYSRFVMPLAGGLLSGNFAAYRYLPTTAALFPAGDAFLGLMRDADCFVETRAQQLWGGIAYVYVGVVK